MKVLRWDLIMNKSDVFFQGYHSTSPDEAVFVQLAHVYADNHKTMALGHQCPGDDFPEGITNGAEWYDVPGKKIRD